MVKDLIGSMKQFDFEEIAAGSKVKKDKESIDFSDSEKTAQKIKEVQAEYKAKGLDISNIEALEKIKGE